MTPRGGVAVAGDAVTRRGRGDVTAADAVARVTRGRLAATPWPLTRTAAIAPTRIVQGGSSSASPENVCRSKIQVCKT